MCFLAALMSLTIAKSLKSAAAVTVVCSSGPTTAVAGNGTFETIYSCTIPANTIAANKGIRITSHVFIASNGQCAEQGDTQLYFNALT